MAGTDASTGSVAVGGVVLLAWIVAAVVSVRRRLAPVLPLHAVVGAALLLGFVSLSRIFGTVWYYLSLWMVGTAGLLLLAFRPGGAASHRVAAAVSSSAGIQQVDIMVKGGYSP